MALDALPVDELDAYHLYHVARADRAAPPRRYNRRTRRLRIRARARTAPKRADVSAPHDRRAERDLVKRREELQRWIDDSPFGPWWGLQVELDDKDAPRVRLPFRPEFQRLGGVLQGACVTVVADVAMWLAIIAAVEGGENAATIHCPRNRLSRAPRAATSSPRRTS